MFSYYSKLSAELYDHTKPIGYSIDGDLEYYLERLNNVKGRILEAGVGTGRLLIPFLEKGLTVDGVDYSAEMLEVCKRHCNERGLSPKLFLFDLEEMQLPDTYEAIIVPTGTFCLIESYEKAVNVLNNFKKHLNRGGRVIIDLFLPYDFQEGETKTAAYQLSNDEGIILESKSISIDWLEQKTITYLKYEKWRAGKLIDTEIQEMQLKWYGIREFTLLLKDLGYTDITCSAGYTYKKSPATSSEIITFEAKVG